MSAVSTGIGNAMGTGGKGGFAEAPMAFGTSMGGSGGPGVNGVNPFTGQAIGLSPGMINLHPEQGPQIGFGPAPIEQNPMQPAPQPVNRFAPPNAPGVRQQPRTAPRAGIPVQSARTVQPNRFTRSRTR